MSIFEDTSNDEALARALQEELDKEVAQVSAPSLPPGTVIYTNSVLGQKSKSKRKRGTHANGLQQAGLAGYEGEDISVQHAIAQHDDAESEEDENTYFDNDVFQNSDINKHLQAGDVRLDDLTVAPKASHTSEEDEEQSNSSSSEPPQYSAKTQRKIARSEEHLAELERIREERSGYIRIECIRNTNAKDRKMKMIPFPKSIKDLLRTVNAAFKATGKKRFTKIFNATGTELKDTSELFPEDTNVLYFSCGEDWGLKPTVWPKKTSKRIDKENLYEEEEEEEGNDDEETSEKQQPSDASAPPTATTSPQTLFAPAPSHPQVSTDPAPLDSTEPPPGP